jgi:citrate lyase subunit beta-like protein
VLPKVNSVEDLEIVTDAMEAFGRAKGTISLVASIESALALHNVGAIAAWRSVYGPEKGGELRALLVKFHLSRDCRYMFIDHLVWGRRLYDYLAFHPRNRLTGGFLVCANTSVIRTPSRQELLYPRSKIAVTAKAFSLEAIDMVRTFCALSLVSV